MKTNFTFLTPVRLKARDGRIYHRDDRGVMTRVFPLKPWANKAEHKQHKRQARAERQQRAIENSA